MAEDFNKPTIVLVGCPSGEAWERCRIEYANLLKSRLKLPKGVMEPIYVAVYSTVDEREKEEQRR